MLSIILGVLGSGGFGSIIGLFGGAVNRFIDLKAKALDLQDKVNERVQELLRMDKEREYMSAEYAMRLQVADKETEKAGVVADGAVEVAGYAAMGESYKFAATTSEDGWVDSFSKLVRPLITLAFLLFSLYIFYNVSLLVAETKAVPDATAALKLYLMTIEWVLFQAGVCIGWWFAMRPGKHPRG